MEQFNEFLSEKQKLEDFLEKLENELNNCLEDFEKVNIEKLNYLNDLIKDNESLAIVIGKNFYKNFSKFQTDFNHFVTTFTDSKRFKIEVTLEDFLDSIQLLKRDLFQES
jgi:hypothetical protein